jgi:hypothetical protein
MRTREVVAMTGQSWLHDPDEAARRAEAEGKLVLVDFFSPT